MPARGERPLSAGRCWGAPGYADYLEAIGGAAYPEYESMLRWGSKAFDPTSADQKALENAIEALAEKMEIPQAETVMESAVNLQSKGPGATLTVRKRLPCTDVAMRRTYERIRSEIIALPHPATMMRLGRPLGQKVLMSP